MAANVAANLNATTAAPTPIVYEALNPAVNRVARVANLPLNGSIIDPNVAPGFYRALKSAAKKTVVAVHPSPDRAPQVAGVVARPLPKPAPKGSGVVAQPAKPAPQGAAVVARPLPKPAPKGAGVVAQPAKPAPQGAAVVARPLPKPAPKGAGVVAQPPNPAPHVPPVVVQPPIPAPQVPIVVVQQPNPAPQVPPVVVQPPIPAPQVPLVVVQPPNPAPQVPPVVVQPPNPAPQVPPVVVQPPNPAPQVPPVVVQQPNPAPQVPPVVVQPPNPAPQVPPVVVQQPNPAPLPLTGLLRHGENDLTNIADDQITQRVINRLPPNTYRSVLTQHINAHVFSNDSQAPQLPSKRIELNFYRTQIFNKVLRAFFGAIFFNELSEYKRYQDTPGDVDVIRDRILNNSNDMESAKEIHKSLVNLRKITVIISVNCLYNEIHVGDQSSGIFYARATGAVIKYIPVIVIRDSILPILLRKK